MEADIPKPIGTRTSKQSRPLPTLPESDPTTLLANAQKNHEFPPGTAFQRVIKWDENGIPTPTMVPVINKDGIGQMASVALSLPANLELTDENIAQMSNAEVGFIRVGERAREGSMEHLRFLLDYSIGKPTQKIESKSMKMTLSEYMETLDDTAPTMKDVPPA